jgi:glycosyltransferase involved in cell wall biosynthesis
VIIPNYNCIKYLPRALDSVLQQSNVSYEILVVDDGSTDGSNDWLSNAEKKYNMLRVFTQKNAGVISARNKAIKHAAGKYIAFLDADDTWYPNKLRAQIDYMDAHSQCGLTFTNYQHVDMQYNQIVDCFSYWTEFKPYRMLENLEYQTIPNAINLLLISNVIGTSSVVVRKSVIEQIGCFDNELQSASDWDCWLKIAMVSEVSFSEAITMDYLVRPDSISANKLKRLKAIESITERVCRLNRINTVTKRKAFARLLESYSEMYREQKNFTQAFKYAFSAFKKDPHKRHLKYICTDILELLKS